MSLVPSVVTGAFAATLILGGEGWADGAGIGLAALAVGLSFWGERQAGGVRVVIDEDGARVLDVTGRSHAMARVRWDEVASGGLELRSTPDSRPRRVLVLKDQVGKDRFQLAPDLCAREHTRAILVVVRSHVVSRGLPFADSADAWP